MKIAMVIHSQTGNTEYLANKILELLKKKGHRVDYIKLTLESDSGREKQNITITNRPDLTPYDAVIFGSHVEAFSLASAMKSYLSDISDLSGKKTVCLTTQGLPFRWMGANHALKQMKQYITAKGGEVIACEDVSFIDNAKREDKITALAEKISNLFSL